MNSLTGDHEQSFVNLDDEHDHHNAQTDAEALEAIRVAIGQSTDFNTEPLPDVLQGLHDEHQLGQHAEEAQQAIHAGMDMQDAPSAIGEHDVRVQSMEEGLRLIGDVAESTTKRIGDIATHGIFVQIVTNSERISAISKALLAMLQGNGLNTADNIDPALQASYVAKADYDDLKAKYDSLQQSTQSGTQGQGKSRKRARLAQPKPEQTMDETMPMREVSSTPVDEKGRKKRSMKLEHLVHQQANRRLGIMYNVSKFESKGGTDLPDPKTAPLGPEESINGVQEFRPDFSASLDALTVKPFIEQVTADVINEWDSGVGYKEPEASHQKIKESVEVYWTRLGKRWNEQCIRALGGEHKDAMVRRKQNQYRRQQSLVARRQAAFDQSPLNVCKLRSLYRTLLTVDFAAKTEERPGEDRAYTINEWHAYRKSQYGSQAHEAHEIIDQFWLSPAVLGVLSILDVFAIDQSSRIKRKGKPKGPAPGFHLPPDLWDVSSLPTIRPKDNQGLPIEKSSGLILFKFHVDPRVIAKYPEWARDLYDNPPIPDGDNLLPSLGDVMNSTVYQHLRPAVKLMHDLHNIPRMSSEQIDAVLAQPDEEIQPAVNSVFDEMFKAEPTTDLSSVNIDLSLDSLVNMTENPYLANNPLANRLTTTLETSGMSDMGSPFKVTPGTSVQARKMDKRTATLPPGGAAMPVPKRQKLDGSTLGDGQQDEVDQEVSADSAFLAGL